MSPVGVSGRFPAYQCAGRKGCRMPDTMLRVGCGRLHCAEAGILSSKINPSQGNFHVAVRHFIIQNPL
ncbi:Uncharacterised protein [Bordetella pertussis]|nr:Uncharacterised protein [Bordetella pertussis]